MGPNHHAGYLPTDRPPLLTTVLSGWQILIAVFPATVLVAILTKFDPGTTLLTSGISTIVAVVASRNRIPFYYGSSFAYIAAVGATVARYGGGATGIAIASASVLGIVLNLIFTFVPAPGSAKTPGP